MAKLAIRPGLLDRLKANAGITSDEAFARTINVSRGTLTAIRDEGKNPSAKFIAGVAEAFSLGIGEVAVIIPDDDATEQSHPHIEKVA